MSDPSVRISPEELVAGQEDRFHRFRLINWWNQERLSQAKILVIGAGALGNEIVKNLALLGIGNLFIADLDRIENSNLSRSILYRATDNGAFKAEVAARASRDIYPKIKAQSFVGNIVYDLGLGVFHWADVILGGLDNREARLAINRACWKVGRPWIDGAIEKIQGIARVFVPDGPCYECTMSSMDWELLQRRRSCNLLTRQEMETGKSPTTPTISSIIAGVQSQEAVKLLHGMTTIQGKGWVFEGLSTEAFQVEYQKKADCYSHDPLESVIELSQGVAEITVRAALDEARKYLGSNATLEIGRDVLEKLVCPNCGMTEEMFVSLGKVGFQKAYCPNCPTTRRQVVTFYKIHGEETFLDRTLSEIGVPPYDILIARTPERALGLLLAGDDRAVLGPLAQGVEGLEWT